MKNVYIIYRLWNVRKGLPVFQVKGYRNREDFGIMSAMEANLFRRCLVACWTACAALGACGASTYYVIDLSGEPDAESYPMDILDGEPPGGWTTEHKTTKLVLRRIEAGTFRMCNQVQVTLTRPFFIGVFEVTSAQYAKVMGVMGGSGDACPQAGISYNTIRGNSSTYAWPGSANVDSSTFIGKLREKTGLLTIDLPTEAQWEYACRAGTTTDFNNGTNLSPDEFGDDENLGALGWYFNNSYGLEEVGLCQTNKWGLYDMHGNVREWCLDRWNESLAGGNDPKGGTSSNWRVVRGGGYESSATNCIASFRDKNNPEQAALHDGFRIACFSAEILHAPTPYEGVYDGQGHGISVDVAMPTNAVISYALSENGPYQTEPILFTNVTGNAETVWYKVEANGYDTVTSNSTVTITKATYDMTGAAWDYDEPFEGDGTEMSVVLTNLPSGVTATYTGNKATEPGTYTAQATFTYDTTNYELPVTPDLVWLEWSILALAVDDIVGRPTSIGTNGVGQVKGTAIDGRRAVVLTAGDSSEAWFEVSVTNALSVSFDWKCSCEGLFKGRPWDYLKFSVDGTQQSYICGETAWTNMSFTLNGEGVQTLRWTYLKDEENNDGQDCAWVANVVITFAHQPEIRFTAVSVENGAVTVAVSAEEGMTLPSAEVKDWLEATSDLSDWVGGAIPITVTDLTEDIAETVRFKVEFPNGMPTQAFLRTREQ